MNKPNIKWKRFLDAWAGIVAAVKEEAHMKFHLLAAFAVVSLAFIFHLSVQEWLVLLVVIAIVVSLELINTAIERAVDLVTEEFHPLAKAAKDIAAGAVLVAAVIAGIVGAIIFLPYIIP
ncbi:diacylglycerol kinase family protein [Anoxybacteroides amylolyticum]|uniref:Prokaryotic diacylglycerol kinase family protein n=1 Tax=Anoxybacteroides amylolyticum TaxID=294699 RepID=A0A167TFU6_9BACL|nr:diacylglycerol kinase family protein [Anoxybacillus amylolyticus]ANB60540.1 prokaryotic diacylglycerol kinase family protein [Anoxybacillus amylolyticus]